MIKHSKKFRKISKKFAALKSNLSKNKLEKSNVNKRFGSRYASLQELYEAVNSVIGDDWLIEDSFDFSLADNVEEGKVATGAFKVLVRITYLGRWGKGEWIELERVAPLYLAESYLPSPQKLESLYTYSKRTMLASMLGIITTESVDHDGNDGSSVLNGLCEQVDVFSFANVFYKKIKNTTVKSDLEILKALVLERISQSASSSNVLLDKMVAECDLRLRIGSESVLTENVKAVQAEPVQVKTAVAQNGSDNVIEFSLSPEQGFIDSEVIASVSEALQPKAPIMPTAQEVITALIANAKNFNEIEVIGSKIKRAKNDDCLTGDVINSLQKQLMAKSKEFIIGMAC